LALVPLDERPVNTQLVADVAAIAGWTVELPPMAILPHFRHGADLDAISSWLDAQVAMPGTRAAIVSLDTFVGGGLIPMRTSQDSVVDLISRLGVLRDIATSHPDVPISAISLVTRASDSYSAVEEPDYWERFGRELHRLGADAHRGWSKKEPVRTPVPREVRHDFAMRRLRNHTVTLAAMGLTAERVLAHLDVTADDTADYSAGSIEQEWLSYWGVLDPALDTPVRPGADETGAVVAARTIAVDADLSPVVRVECDPDGLARTPPFENDPLMQSVPRQIHAAGGRPEIKGEQPADIVLVIHAPDPSRGDHFASIEPRTDPFSVSDTMNRIRSALSTGLPVVVADVRFVNGGDIVLANSMRDEGLLQQLAGYAGWNTAGNALGSAVAIAVTTAVARARGSYQAGAARRALHRRLLDDVLYQAEIRRKLAPSLFRGEIGPISAEARARAEIRITESLIRAARDWGIEAPHRVGLPWSRSFEVKIEFDE
jgi:hypothetical protein